MPSSIITRNKTFWEREGLTGDLHQKFFRIILEDFSLIFLFFEGFLMIEILLLFPVGEERFLSFMLIPSSIFWLCEIDEILTMSLYAWFSV